VSRIRNMFASFVEGRIDQSEWKCRRFNSPDANVSKKLENLKRRLRPLRALHSCGFIRTPALLRPRWRRRNGSTWCRENGRGFALLEGGGAKCLWVFVDNCGIAISYIRNVSEREPDRAKGAYMQKIKQGSSQLRRQIRTLPAAAIHCTFSNSDRPSIAQPQTPLNGSQAPPPTTKSTA